jgi:hypothetical protein
VGSGEGVPPRRVFVMDVVMGAT